ncbi:MAG: toll/interleukin-1 receptor domain-containing protein [bacterium]|nr:toll/interleukin-1 receptor domain-containing protein [bacterium]
MALRIYVNGITGWRDEILDAFVAQNARLDLAGPVPPVFETDDPALPEGAVVLYLSDGSRAANPAEEASLRAHLEASRAVIPVVDDVNGVRAKLPECLHDYNAYAVGTGTREYGALIDEIMTRLWLRRSVRKVFLSYRRSDSSAVAYQVRDKLTRRGYNVFLDECTLHPGVAVQREIFWWLNDADLILLLCSPNLGESGWVIDEISAANATEVPILGVVWPDCKPPSGFFPDQVHRLDTDAFVDPTGKPHEQELTPDAFDEMLREVETFRTQGVRQRLVNLLPYARDSIAPRFAPRAAASLGDLELDDPSSRGSFYLRVLPFRATVDEIYDLRRELTGLNPAPREAFIFYPENDPNDPRRTALDWAFAPPRQDEDPRRYRLLSYLGDGDADLGELAP